MIQLKNEEHESYLNQINYHICKKHSNINTVTINIIAKLKTIVVMQINARSAAHGRCNFKIKEILVVCHSEPISDNLIIKELAKEFQREINCLGENTEKYKNCQFQ